MSKKEAIAIFNDEWELHIKYRQPNHANDICAKREMFVAFIDTLRQDGQITDRQVRTWTNPF